MQQAQRMVPDGGLSHSLLNVAGARGNESLENFGCGDFFKTTPTGGDACIPKHIIHEWNDERCETFLNNCPKGMVPRRKVLVVKMVVPEGNEPSISKLSDLQMLAILPEQERTVNESKNALQQGRI